MLILKILGKIILFPIFLIMCFIRIWVMLLSRVGVFAIALFYMLMAVLLIIQLVSQNWFGVGLAIGVSFVAFLPAFAMAAIDTLFEDICSYLGGVLVS